MGQTKKREHELVAVVCIGTAAGGSAALQSFWSAISTDTGCAFVVVSHTKLDPENALDDSSTLILEPIKNNMRLQANRVYFAPRHTHVTLRKGTLRVRRSEKTDSPIDVFMQSLAADQGAKAVGIILSGVGSDGVVGLQAIADADGMTMSQEAGTADYDSMPRAAIASGIVDHVLPPQQLARELNKYTSYLNEMSSPRASGALKQQIEQVLSAICDTVQAGSEHDFRHYKPETLIRRIQRRMFVLKMVDAEAYLTHLQDNPAEVKALFDELLIGVTAFLRDPDAFAALARDVMPKLFVGRESDENVRIWVPGCASGEEAYSIAMLLRSHMDSLKHPPEVQIFATDIDEQALNTARKGRYAMGIEQVLSEDYLKRFFVRKGRHYQVVKEIREMCLFSRHNLINDPPLSRLDLISCRNVLIYLGAHLQQKLIPLFHQALRPGGYLFLGSAENLTEHRALFEIVSSKHRISRRKGTVVDDGISSQAPVPETGRTNLPPGRGSMIDDNDNLKQVTQRIVLDEFAPKYAVVDDEQHIIYVSQGASKYLELGAGLFSNNIVRLARSGLRVGLRSALKAARTKRRKIIRDNLSITTEKGLQPVTLIVQPMPELGSQTGLCMVVFQDAGSVLQTTDGKQSDKIDQEDSLLEQLERELSTTRQDLEKTVQELEASNEELKSSNEELRTLNEEYQSTNEELESAKDETQNAVDALAKAKSDLENLLKSTEIATIFLDKKLNIQLFTPSATRLFNLIETDIGRPLAHLTHRAIQMPELPTIEQLQSTGEPQEDSIVTQDGKTFLRRVSLYSTEEQTIKGLVLTFTDVTELRESHEQIRLHLAEIEAFYHTAPIGMCFIDTELRYLRINERLAEINGLPVEDHIGKKPGDIIPQLQEQVVPALEHVIATGESIENREVSGKTFAQPDTEHDWLVSYHPLLDDEQKVRGVSALVVDITERKRMEQALHNSEERIRLLLDSTAEAIYGIDQEGNCTFCNDTCLKILGYSKAEQIIGNNMHELIHHSKADHTRYEKKNCPIYQVLKNGKGVEVEDEVFWRVDDQPIPVSYSSYPMLHEGKPVGAVVTFRDISEQLETQRILKRQASLLELSNDAIIIWRFDTGIEYWNSGAEAMYGYDKQGAQGQDVHELLQTVFPKSRQDIQTEIKNRGQWSGELIHKAKNGHRIVVSSRHQLIEEADGTQLVLELNRDISDRKQFEQSLRDAQQAAEAANRSKSQFLANMSHEIRTPMTAILGYADVLAMHLDDPDNMECVATIKRNGRYLLDVVNDILDLSKIEAGKLQLQHQQCSPVKLVADVRSLMQVRAQEKQLPLLLEYETSIPTCISTDPVRLRQILINLLSNAIKFTEQGTVKVSIAYLSDDTEPSLRFRVQDDGIGINEEQQQLLFQPFTQADSSHSRRYGGTGLGLAISQRLAQMLGGRITLDSSPGEGTVASLTLPANVLENTELIDPSSDIITSNNTSAVPVSLSSRLLVVDDRRDIRYLVRHFLENAGAEVVMAENGQAGIDALHQAEAQKKPFDIVVMDMQMPVMDGYQATAKLRAQGFQQPIIALTAGAMQGEREKCLRAGCDEFISKPIESQRLLEVINRLERMAQHQARQSKIQLPTQASEAETAHRRILIVDDSEDASSAMSKLLSMLQHDVQIAHTGHAAIDMAHNYKPDVIIIDIGLPDIDGYEVAHRLTMTGAFDDTVFIALSGSDADQTRVTTVGFDHYLMKPASINELLPLMTRSTE